MMIVENLHAFSGPQIQLIYEGINQIRTLVMIIVRKFTFASRFVVEHKDFQTELKRNRCSYGAAIITN